MNASIVASSRPRIAVSPQSAPFDIPQSPRLEQALARIDALGQQVERAKDAHPELWPAVFEKLKLLWTADSNAIEGSSLSFGDTKFFLETGLTVEGKPLKDFLDARNHHDAIGMLFELAGQARPITEGALKELNALLLRGVASVPSVNRSGQRVEKAISPGAYKREPNTVLQADGGIHKYVDPLLVPEHMGRLVVWLEADALALHPALVAAIAHYEFVRIHPFDDGNGRGARILMNLVLIRSGFPPCVVRREQRAAYLEALRRADAGDREPFASFILTALSETLEAMLEDFKA
jgi:Fic family protein